MNQYFVGRSPLFVVAALAVVLVTVVGTMAAAAVLLVAVTVEAAKSQLIWVVIQVCFLFSGQIRS